MRRPSNKRAAEPAPEPEPEPPPPSGHNQPPPSASLGLSADEWAAWMAHIFEGVAARKEELLASFQRFTDGYPLTNGPVGAPPVGIEKWNDDVQGRAGDLRQKFADLLKQSEALHSIEKGPVLTATRVIDGHLRAFRASLDEAMTAIRRRQSVYALWLEDQSRRAAQAEAQAAIARALAAEKEAVRTLDPDALQKSAEAEAEAEHAQREAEAPAADHSRVHGPMGSVTSLRTNWKFIEEESDLMALAKAVVAGHAPIAYLAFNTTRINIAVRSEKVREVPGCVIRDDKRI